MTFDIQKEKLDLDRFATWWHLKYHNSNQHICDGCVRSCGCMWNEGETISNNKIIDVWERFVASRITADRSIAKAKQAYWAMVEFEQHFQSYYWMNWDHFAGENNYYYIWKYYLKTYLNLQEGETEKYEYNNSGDHILVWEKPLEGAWYKTAKTHSKTEFETESINTI